MTSHFSHNAKNPLKAELIILLQAENRDSVFPNNELKIFLILLRIIFFSCQ